MFSNLSDRTLLLMGAVLCSVAAWCTIGYHHPDEHFQIWEFASYKLGQTQASDLPWEFSEKMRPGLQPFLAFCMVWTTRLLGLDNPFVQVFLMRWLCGVAALFVYWKWASRLEQDLSSPVVARWVRFGILFFWMMPYLNVRFSSENTSAICFFGGLLLLAQELDNQKNRLNGRMIAAGLLLCLSFFFRYQIAFAGIGLGAWLLFQKKPAAAQWLSMITGALLGVGLGLLCDYWLYGEWVCTPYNYFFSNIVEGKAAGFGTSPFWWYLTEMPVALLPPMSILLLVLCALGVWRKPAHLLSWCVIPFLLAHALVGHKEVRFLFPMALPFFFFAAAGWDSIKENFKVKPWMSKAFMVLLWVNAIVLIFRVLTPAKETTAYYKFLSNWSFQHPASSIYFVKKEPSKDATQFMPFYNNRNQDQKMWYTDPGYPNDTAGLKANDLMLFTTYLSPPPKAPEKFIFKREFAYYPDWLLANNTNNWQSRTRIWTIYRLVKTD